MTGLETVSYVVFFLGMFVGLIGSAIQKWLGDE